MTGRYIVLEGIQGGGKTTQVELLAERLKKAGKAVYITREPGGSDLAARMIRYITQNPQYPLDTKAEVLLYNAARVQSLQVVRDLTARGVWVVCDRNYLTTLAIQYYARNDGLAYDDIARICEFAVGNMEPDHTIILDLDAKTAASRVKNRTIKERFDGLSVDFLQRMRDGYVTEASKRQYPIVDANQNEQAVADHIWDIVMTKTATSTPSTPTRHKYDWQQSS